MCGRYYVDEIVGKEIRELVRRKRGRDREYPAEHWENEEGLVRIRRNLLQNFRQSITYHFKKFQ